MPHDSSVCLEDAANEPAYSTDQQLFVIPEGGVNASFPICNRASTAYNRTLHVCNNAL